MKNEATERAGEGQERRAREEATAASAGTTAGAGWATVMIGEIGFHAAAPRHVATTAVTAVRDRAPPQIGQVGQR